MLSEKTRTVLLTICAKARRRKARGDVTLRGSMTPRERDIAALLIERETGNEIVKALGISPRTVDVYKTRLLRKYGVASAGKLVKQLL